MNRRNLLKMIPGAAAALLALGFRKPKASPPKLWCCDTDLSGMIMADKSPICLDCYAKLITPPVEFISPDVKWIQPSGKMVWVHEGHLCDPLGVGDVTPEAKLHIRTECHDILMDLDPASPDGDYTASVTMIKTPEGWIATDWEDNE